MRRTHHAFAAALGALITLPVLVGAAGAVCPEELSVFYGDKAYEHFGSSIAAVSDLDGDAATDLLVGGSNRYDAPGLARVFSGATGEVIYRFVDAYPSNGFGSPVNNAGDVDADGITDLIVAARQVQNIYNPGTGFVRVFSGADGALLYTWGGIQIGEAFGTAVASAGDMDQDGFADVAVGAPYYSRSEESLVGYVRVFSGRTGEIIHHIEGGFAFDNLGAAVDGVDDIDGDGVS
ncbi:MAG: FG-GAP repeat protein, partial [Myxococcales bacterium]|nr:FG-GAP repeat protein [Myxococcales bacterium]